MRSAQLSATKKKEKEKKLTKDRRDNTNMHSCHLRKSNTSNVRVFVLASKCVVRMTSIHRQTSAIKCSTRESTNLFETREFPFRLYCYEPLRSNRSS